MEEKDINRLLMQFEHLLKQSNRERINPEIEELAIDDLKPLVDLVARSRATYLKALYELSKKYDGQATLPTQEELEQLKVSRTRFLDLADGAKSIEICIQRGYLDLKT
ncbi:MAG: hypothetical protein R3183_01845 [Oleiphilaceae bacterium]|nr:hypothetical protein [Oleiphilaceae bacterium]